MLRFKLERSRVPRGAGPTYLPIGHNWRAEDERLSAELLNALGDNVTHLAVVIVARRSVRVCHRHDDDRLAEVLLLPADSAEHRAGGGAVGMVLPVLLRAMQPPPPSFQPAHGESSRLKQNRCMPIAPND